jgi:homocysteine S-methyltransferase
VLADAAPDLLAVETVATLAEVGDASCAELDGVGAPAWVSVTPRGRTRCAAARRSPRCSPCAAAQATTCSPWASTAARPDEATDAIAAAAMRPTSKPIVVYPNSGERRDAVSAPGTARARSPKPSCASGARRALRSSAAAAERNPTTSARGSARVLAGASST